MGIESSEQETGCAGSRARRISPPEGQRYEAFFVAELVKSFGNWVRSTKVLTTSATLKHHKTQHENASQCFPKGRVAPEEVLLVARVSRGP